MRDPIGVLNETLRRQRAAFAKDGAQLLTVNGKRGSGTLAALDHSNAMHRKVNRLTGLNLKVDKW